MNDSEIIRLSLQGIKIMPLETRRPVRKEKRHQRFRRLRMKRRAA